jgi:virulence-associated protein VagC
MPRRAKLIERGGSQVVQLPEEYRFEDQEEVLIYRQGRRVILEPERQTWSREFLDLAGSARDFPDPGELVRTSLPVRAVYSAPSAASDRAEAASTESLARPECQPCRRSVPARRP